MKKVFNIVQRETLVSAQLNQHLGKKLRLRRTSLGLTQTQVAKAINVTFQQIQKYEKGTNGVSSARLLQLSSFLKVPIKYFFEDYQDFSSTNESNVASKDVNYSFLVRLFNEHFLYVVVVKQGQFGDCHKVDF